MLRPRLSPSMMCLPEWEDARAALQAMVNNGVEMLHADVMDGSFVPNLMLGTESVKHLRKISPVPLDLHLMIERPEEKLSWFDPQPGEQVAVHVESTRHLQRLLTRIRNCGARPVAALNPATPLCMVEDVLDDVDGVLLMTVNPGFAGQKLIEHSLDRIARLRRMLDDAGRTDVFIEADGNVSFENAPKMRAAGADTFVCGSSSIFSSSGTIAGNTIRFLRGLENI